MGYDNPTQAGKDAFTSGLKQHECPADSRTHANAVEWWKQGWDAAAKNCKGIEIEPCAFSGCDQPAGDFPTCGK